MNVYQILRTGGVTKSYRKLWSVALNERGHVSDIGARNTTHVTRGGVELEPYFLRTINIRMSVSLHCVLCQTEA